MKVKPVEEIKDFLTPIGNEVGVEVVEVEFKQGKDPALTVYIDRPEGIDLDICEKFHRAIDVPLDELDPTFGEPYRLNVSSLGIDRPFKSEEDFISTMQTCKTIGFSKIHVFPYSKREGTKAASMDGHLPNSIKKERARRLIEIDKVGFDEYGFFTLGKDIWIVFPCFRIGIPFGNNDSI